jgi:hypothetical protein
MMHVKDDCEGALDLGFILFFVPRLTLPAQSYG